MMIMIGATLEKGPGKGRVPLRVLAAITISRLLVLPIIGTVLVFGTYQLGWYDAPDEIFLMVMLVQQCAPTAMNAATMAAVLDNGDVEMSVVLFWQYVLLVLVMPLFLSLFLVLLHAWFPRGGGR